MKVLVAGGAGYIGSVTTEMLCNEGHDTASHYASRTVDPEAPALQVYHDRFPAIS